MCRGAGSPLVGVRQKKKKPGTSPGEDERTMEEGFPFIEVIGAKASGLQARSGELWGRSQLRRVGWTAQCDWWVEGVDRAVGNS